MTYTGYIGHLSAINNAYYPLIRGQFNKEYDMTMMKSLIFVEPGKIEIVDKKIPDVGPNDALLKITTTTICGTDIHIFINQH